jgi:hypothetical protein
MSLWIDAVELCGIDQHVARGGALTALLGAAKVQLWRPTATSRSARSAVIEEAGSASMRCRLGPARRLL